MCYNYNILYIFDDGLVVTTGKYYILYIEQAIVVSYCLISVSLINADTDGDGDVHHDGNPNDGAKYIENSDNNSGSNNNKSQ